MVPSRADLIQRGVLVDLMSEPWVSEVVRAGFRLPVAMDRNTFDLHVAVHQVGRAAGPDSLTRLRTILQLSRKAAEHAQPSASTGFNVSVEGTVFQLNLSIRELSDGPYLLIRNPSLIRYLVIENGVLRKEVDTHDGAERALRRLLPGGIDGVPIPSPSSGVGMIGYCDARAFESRLGANCYVLGLRYPIPGPLVIFALNGDDHGPLAESDAAEFQMRTLPGRPLPTLWVDGYEEDHAGDDPAVDDTYRPGVSFDAPGATIMPVIDEFLP